TQEKLIATVPSYKDSKDNAKNLGGNTQPKRTHHDRINQHRKINRRRTCRIFSRKISNTSNPTNHNRRGYTMRDFKTLYTMAERNEVLNYIIQQDINFASREDMLDEYEESLKNMYESATDTEIKNTLDAWTEGETKNLKEQEMKNKIEDLYILENKLIWSMVEAEKNAKAFKKELNQVRESIKNISIILNR
ncbi:hypothetical protein, partial [Staphylococcus aureus]|uniref:hypothetical protein n=1 Tax=Staphylococcus aureus TaxID=1280 RepID=UPI001582BCA9